MNMEFKETPQEPYGRPKRYTISLPRGIGVEIRQRARLHGTMPAFYVEQVMRKHLDSIPAPQAPIIA